mmetsp:Transcript_1649/g.4941  ORF Transcript_1649/g.4941 Transcript_1649/m.4941 type:complete len:240 (+) Transcript_1649:1214-1933(+)
MRTVVAGRRTAAKAWLGGTAPGSNTPRIVQLVAARPIAMRELEVQCLHPDRRFKTSVTAKHAQAPSSMPVGTSGEPAGKGCQASERPTMCRRKQALKRFARKENPPGPIAPQHFSTNKTSPDIVESMSPGTISMWRGALGSLPGARAPKIEYETRWDVNQYTPASLPPFLSTVCNSSLCSKRRYVLGALTIGPTAYFCISIFAFMECRTRWKPSLASFPAYFRRTVAPPGCSSRKLVTS